MHNMQHTVLGESFLTVGNARNALSVLVEGAVQNGLNPQHQSFKETGLFQTVLYLQHGCSSLFCRRWPMFHHTPPALVVVYSLPRPVPF